MKFMNTYEIDEAVERYRSHPVLGPATRTLESLRDCANANSDGWAYWPKPANAAAKLMGLIEGDGLDPRNVRFDRERFDATPEKLRKALSPIKAFRTKSGLDFAIYDGGENDDALAAAEARKQAAHDLVVGAAALARASDGLEKAGDDATLSRAEALMQQVIDLRKEVVAHDHA